MATPFLPPSQRAAPMVRPDYSLNAAPRPVGRSMSDPARMQDVAMRRLRSQGDFQGAARLAQSQAWLDARFGGRQAPVLPAGAMPVPQPPPAADANAMPAGGRLVPGRSAGSLVWQTDAPPMPEVPTAPPASEAVPALPAPAAPPAVPMLEGINPLTGLPFANAPSMMPEGWNAMNRGNAALGLAMPAPGLYGPEGPPRFQEFQAGDMNVIVDSTTGKQVQSYKRPEAISYAPVPGTNLLMPRGDGADRLPLMQQQGVIEAPRPQADFAGPMPGMANLVPYQPPGQPETRTIYNKDGIANTMQFNPETGEWEPVPMKKKEAATSAAAPAAAGPVTLPKGSTAKGATWSLF